MIDFNIILQYTTMSPSCFPNKILYEFELGQIFMTSVHFFISSPSELVTWEQTGTLLF